MMRKLIVMSAFVAALGAHAGNESTEKFIFVDPDQTAFWRTVASDSFTVPIEYPDGATSATLTIEGLGHSDTIANITDDSVAVTLPPVTSTAEEDVYLFTLAFDNGVTNKVSLGHIKGYGTDGEGTTRVLNPQGANNTWQRVAGRSVLPIPYGATSLTVNGAEVETGLDGAAGWYALPGMERGESVELVLTVDDVQYPATILGWSALGSLFILQ